MSLNELEERVARLNTQLRFGRLKPALTEAYKLRTFIQLNCALKGDALSELQRVEKVISELEGKNVVGVQKLVKAIITTAKASLNPKKESEETLLDRFSVPFDPLRREDMETPPERSDILDIQNSGLDTASDS